MIKDSWKTDFLNCLELGTSNVALANHFDQIVVWVRSEGDGDELYTNLEVRYSKDWIQLRYEEFLDRLFLSETPLASIFPPSLSTEEAKTRYRQLIRIFHPDRGAHEEVWLNYRAEIINKAFKEYEGKREVASVAISPMNVNIPTPNKNIAEPRLSTKIKYKPNLLREKLGNARQVQQKIITGLIFGAIVLVLLVFASSRTVTDSRVLVASQDEIASLADDRAITEDLRLSNVKAKKILDDAQWLNEPPEFNVQRLQTPEDQGGLPSTELVNFSDFDTNVGVSEAKLASVVSTRNTKRSENSGEERDDSKRRQITNSSSSKVDRKPTSSLRLSKRATVDDARNHQKETIPKPITKSQGEKDERHFSTSSTRFRLCDDASAEALKPTQGVDFSITSDLNARSGPSSECLILNSLTKGEKVVVRKRVRSMGVVWVQLSLSDVRQRTNLGWVQEKFLEPVQAKYRKGLASGQKNSGRAAAAGSEQKVRIETSLNAQPSEKLEVSRSKAVVKGVIAQLDKAYETGDSESLAALYMSSGRENGVRGVTNIAKTYSKLFKKTHSRKVDYKISSYNMSDLEKPVLGGTMITSAIVSSTGKEYRSVAKVEFHMARIGDSYKIVLFKWSVI